MIFIKGAKGRKDRYTTLSNVTLEALRTYYKSAKPRDWLFPGQKDGRHISTRTVEKVFKEIINKVGIKKNVSVHSLRYSGKIISPMDRLNFGEGDKDGMV